MIIPIRSGKEIWCTVSIADSGMRQAMCSATISARQETRPWLQRIDIRNEIKIYSVKYAAGVLDAVFRS